MTVAVSLSISPRSFFRTQSAQWESSRLSDLFRPNISIDLVSQAGSAAERMILWGLKNSDVTFVRREIRSLLFKYIAQGDASVEYL